jgi:hypothetical protein
MNRLLLWLAVAIAAYYLFTNPDGAAALVLHVLNGLRQFASHL